MDEIKKLRVEDWRKVNYPNKKLSIELLEEYKKYLSEVDWMKKKELIKYIFEVARPKEDFKIRNKANTLKQLMNKANIRVYLPMGYFKGCKTRFRCVEMKGNKIVRELEKYRYVKGKGIYGYFPNWESMGEETKTD